MLGACVSQSAYDQLQAQNQQLQTQLAQSRAEQKFVEAGDMLFPEGGFQLSQAGQTELANNIAPKLRGLQNAKVVVYGYTDNTPVGTRAAAARCSRQLGAVDTPRGDGGELPGVAGRQPQYYFGQRFRRDSSGSFE
jgi:outer membrane protein OmpA-like peptidoglycan-associated protein